MANLLTVVTTFASGTLGDTIHSRNASGPYTRPFVVPTDPNTQRQARIRAKFSLISQQWAATLAKDQRAAWATYAAHVQVPSVSGRPQFLTGQQMFIRCNMPRPQPVAFSIRDAPVIFNHGEFSTPTVETVQFVDLILVLFTGDHAWQNQDGSQMLVQVSDGQSAGTKFFAAPFRFAGAIPGSSINPPVGGQTLFDPFVPHADGPRWARVRISFSDGRLSPARIFQFLPLP